MKQDSIAFSNQIGGMFDNLDKQNSRYESFASDTYRGSRKATNPGDPDPLDGLYIKTRGQWLRIGNKQID